MSERRPPHTPPSNPDGDGVRVVAKPPAPRRGRAWAVLAMIAVLVGVVWWGWMHGQGPGPDNAVAPIAPHEDSNRTDGLPPSAQPVAAMPAAGSAEAPSPMPNHDPDDLANYFQPGDPEPSGAEVIKGLQAAGVRTGLGAFNPPGTSPPLEGLAVPADFPLPDGYVRHHQVTDEGVPIEPILMFAPGFTLHDAMGRPIAMPANGVVPPELAPPGLPLRWVRIGKP